MRMNVIAIPVVNGWPQAAEPAADAPIDFDFEPQIGSVVRLGDRTLRVTGVEIVIDPSAPPDRVLRTLLCQEYVQSEDDRAPRGKR